MGKIGTYKKFSLSVGDVVIVHKHPRTPWGLWWSLRGAIVKTMNTDGQPELLRQTIQRLYQSEVMESSDSNGAAAENARGPEVASPSGKTLRFSEDMVSQQRNPRLNRDALQLNKVKSKGRQVKLNLKRIERLEPYCSNWTVLIIDL